jgi:hypothetical protein
MPGRQRGVVRKLEALLPTVRDEALHAELTEMLKSHRDNIELVEAYSPEPGTVGDTRSQNAHSAQALRASITSQIQAETGIDEAMIEPSSRSFCDRVRDDVILGPIFAAKIENWEPHLQKMFGLWSSVALANDRNTARRSATADAWPWGNERAMFAYQR